MYVLVKITPELDTEAAAELVAKVKVERRGDARVHIDGVPLDGVLVDATLHTHPYLAMQDDFGSLYTEGRE